jgi:hypothetical protein
MGKLLRFYNHILKVKVEIEVYLVNEEFEFTCGLMKNSGVFTCCKYMHEFVCSFFKVFNLYHLGYCRNKATLKMVGRIENSVRIG